MTPGFVVAVHFANVQRPATRKMTNPCASPLMLQTCKMCVCKCVYIYIYLSIYLSVCVCKPWYLLITSFSSDFQSILLCKNSSFSRVFLVSLVSLLPQQPPTPSQIPIGGWCPLHENAPTVGKGSSQRVDCNSQVDI